MGGTIPTSWSKLAWPSRRQLVGWMDDLEKRIEQLSGWASNPLEVPRVTWISGLINPRSFLTAIMQQAAQTNSWELDKLFVQTEVTKKVSADAIEAAARDGNYITGLSLEGARWNISGTILEKSLPREMFFEMPIILCRALSLTNAGKGSFYECPVYKTRQRGPTFVFCAQLKTKSKSERWVMAGVALIMDASE